MVCGPNDLPINLFIVFKQLNFSWILKKKTQNKNETKNSFGKRIKIFIYSNQSQMICHYPLE